MTLFRQSRLAETAPTNCRREIETVNEVIHQRLRELTVARFGNDTTRHLTLVKVAAIDSPYGMLRTYVWAEIPEWPPKVIEAASAAILALGDDTS